MTGSSKPGLAPSAVREVLGPLGQNDVARCGDVVDSQAGVPRLEEGGQDGMNRVRADVAVARQRDVPVVHLSVEQSVVLIKVHLVPRLANPPRHRQVVLDDGRLFPYSHVVLPSTFHHAPCRCDGVTVARVYLSRAKGTFVQG